MTDGQGASSDASTARLAAHVQTIEVVSTPLIRELYACIESGATSDRDDPPSGWPALMLRATKALEAESHRAEMWKRRASDLEDALANARARTSEGP